jgi:hypothetical protein
MDLDQLATLEDARNDGWPSGKWAGAPSLAASTVAMTNTSGVPQSVYVSGGTVTVIAVDGVATGLTTGHIYVRRDGTLTITYSSAPTVNWFPAI